MHVLFVHQAMPAQFGPVAKWLSRSKEHRVTFVSTDLRPRYGAIENIPYQYSPPPKPGTDRYWMGAYQRHLLHCRRVARAVRKRPDLKPDLVVGHSGFGPTLFLPQVLDCPIVSYFEYFMDTKRNDMLYRTDFTHPEWFHRWRQALNAVFLADLDRCESGYSPMHWQRSLFPKGYQPKIRVHFDGIDTTIFRPLPVHTAVDWIDLPKGARIVTYVSRGFESMRGFDIFMKVAKRIYTAYPNVIFVVAGLERVAYSNDPRLFGVASFKRWVLKQDSYDLSKFRFVGWLSTSRLAQLFKISTLHIYLTTPFPLSWSCFSALACGATVLASDTEPVREVVEHGRNGLLAKFFDVDELAGQAVEVLRSPSKYCALGRNAAEHIQKTYAAEATVPRLVEYFQETTNRPTARRIADNHRKA